ncbi:MAG: 3'-5' exonuclease [Hylemonella sp.]|nr:3'-5' exonuclease [Hylemonella sp.]
MSVTTEQLDFGFDPGVPSAAQGKGAKPRKAAARKPLVPRGPSALPLLGDASTAQRLQAGAPLMSESAQAGADVVATAQAAAPTEGEAQGEGKVHAPMQSETPAQIHAPAEALARELERHPDYRVLRRLVPRLDFDGAAPGSVLNVLVLDTETTGLDATKDKIIELALLRVQVDSITGLPVGAVRVHDGLQDPGIPISKEVQEITGITNVMVQGQQLDEACIAEMLDGVDLVIAHNAGFDRPFCEARLPAFAALRWGCSLADVDWKAAGYSSAKLEQLALANGWFYDAHRAEVDCHALLAVLGVRLKGDLANPMLGILAASGTPSYRLQANGAPFDAKDLLKARGYRWNAEQKVWHTVLASANTLQAEFEWLKAHVYGARSARLQVEKLDALTKYSTRAGEMSVQGI